MGNGERATQSRENLGFSSAGLCKGQEGIGEVGLCEQRSGESGQQAVWVSKVGGNRARL